MSPFLPGERDPAQVQAERGTPGQRAAQRATFGSDESRRSVARDALKAMAWADTEPVPGYPYAGRTQEQEEEAALRDIGEADLLASLDENIDEPPDPIGDAVLALPEDHDGAQEHGPFVAGALAGEAMLRSGDVAFEGYEDEPLDDESEAVFIDVDTGEPIDPDMLDEYEVIDEGRDLPPAA